MRRIMRTFQNELNQNLNDPDFRKEWKKMQPEMAAVRAIMKARIEQRMTHDQLSEVCAIDQSVISKLENGTRVPSLKMLKRLAAGPGKTVKIDIV